jgi:NADP-dependent 3-hydroxy acid dehydrogenase YdfG
MPTAPFLSGQVAIVTGASSGIGRHTASLLAAAGARVVLAARRALRLEGLAVEINQDHPGCALVVPTDVRDDQQLERMVAAAREAFGRIDILVNNAGYVAVSPVSQLDPARLDDIMRVNFRAPVLATRLVLPEMLERRSGAIVNVGSVSSRRGWPTGTPYVASKFALRGFALCLWEEVRRSNIRVVNVYPDFVASELFSAAGGSLEHADRAIPPRDVAAVIVNALQLDGRTTVTEIDMSPTNMAE